MNLDLSGDEADALLDILQRELSRLKGEIYHTEDREFKAGLKKRKAIIVALIERLSASARPAA